MDVAERLTRIAEYIIGPHVQKDVLRRAIADRLRTAPPHIARRLALAVRILDNRWTNLGLARRFARISEIQSAEGAAIIESWLTSRHALARSVGHGVRRFVLATYYAQPEAQSALGILPPLHTREPAYSWEGPLPGETHDDEPVARGSSRLLAAGVRNPARRELPPGVHRAGEWSDTNTHYFRADVVIIGSGAGGAVAAARLAEAGRDVIVIEAGRWVQSADFSEREHEIGPDLYADGALRTTDDGAFTLLQGGALGGGTTVNWMLMLRTPDHVLEEWAREHGTEGMSPSEMRAVFDRVERETHTTLVPDDAHNPPNRLLMNGARALGWHVQAARINARGCVRAGTCSLGCRYGAKQSAIQVYLPRAIAAGARVLTDAVVKRIVQTSRDVGGQRPPQKRVYATVRSPDGQKTREVLIDAAKVVLAAGAVETPLILKRSGLGGAAVGRFLRLHPTTAVLAHMPNETYPLAGVPQTTVCAEFANRGNGYGFWIECPAFTPGLAAAAVSGIGTAHRAWLERLSHIAPLIALIRDGAGARRDESYGSVTLGLGGVPQIRFRLRETDAQHLREAIAASARIALAGGAVEVLTLHTKPITIRRESDLAAVLHASVAPNDVTLYSAHLNGTCRIGRDKRTAGVQPDGQLFGMRGLYVVDGSILPTAPGVNPQETIYAMATVLAERMG